MDETTTLPPAANDDALPGEAAVPDTAWRSEGPDGLFNHYRRRRLLALGALAQESAA